jgi:hypothetical protein
MTPRTSQICGRRSALLRSIEFAPPGAYRMPVRSPNAPAEQLEHTSQRDWLTTREPFIHPLSMMNVEPGALVFQCIFTASFLEHRSRLSSIDQGRPARRVSDACRPSNPPTEELQSASQGGGPTASDLIFHPLGMACFITNAKLFQVFDSLCRKEDPPTSLRTAFNTFQITTMTPVHSPAMTYRAMRPSTKSESIRIVIV